MDLIDKIVSVTKRPTLSRSGQPDNEYFIEFLTVLGASGNVTIPEREYNAMTPDELGAALNNAAELANRPFMLLKAG